MKTGQISNLVEEIMKVVRHSLPGQLKGQLFEKLSEILKEASDVNSITGNNNSKN